MARVANRGRSGRPRLGRRSAAAAATTLLLLGALPASAAEEAAAPPLRIHVPLELVRGLETVTASPPAIATDMATNAPQDLDTSALPPGDWSFGGAPVTKTESLKFAVSADRTTLWFDSDRDGRLSPAEKLAPARNQDGITWFAPTGRIRQPVLEETRELDVPMAVGVRQGTNVVHTRLDAHRRGTISMDGRTIAIAVVDRTFRGWFGHRGRDELLVDVDGDGAFDTAPDSNERFALGRPFPAGDRDLVVEEIEPFGAALTLAASKVPAMRLPSLAIGRPAPGLDAKGLDGRPVRLADLAGRWVLLDFWATWCGPCREEIPHLASLAKARPDLALVGISSDRDKATLERFVSTNAMKWPQVFDEGGTISTTYRVTSLPRTFLIGPDGRIAAKDLRGDALARALADRAGPPPPATAPR